MLKSTLADILRGVLIGVANVIPGVSGGTMAVSMGVYQKIIDSINNIKKDFKNSIKTLWPFLVGMAIGIVGLAFVINYLLTNFEIPTVFCFIGLVMGGVPAIVDKIDDKRIKWTHVVSFLITLSIIIVPTLLAINAEPITTITPSLISLLILFGLGIISASAMVVPGVSGSMILMMLGYYNIIISTVKDTVSQVLKFDFSSLLSNMLIIIPFGIGVLAGIIIISKIISFVMRKYPNSSYWAILGLVVASPFAIIAKIATPILSINYATVIASIVTFALGCFISRKLGDK